MANELFWAQLKKWGFAPVRFEKAVEIVEARRFPQDAETEQKPRQEKVQTDAVETEREEMRPVMQEGNAVTTA